VGLPLSIAVIYAVRGGTWQSRQRPVMAKRSTASRPFMRAVTAS
jgi:hypothetical protein